VHPEHNNFVPTNNMLKRFNDSMYRDSTDAIDESDFLEDSID